MLRSKTSLLINEEQNINIESWLQNFINKYQIAETGLIREACALSQHTGENRSAPSGLSCLQQGLLIAEILGELNLDPETLAAGIIYSNVRFADLAIEDVSEQLGKNVAKLVVGVKEMDALHHLHEQMEKTTNQHTTIDNLRKMLLAIVDDVRVVLIKLAERLCILRNTRLFSEAQKQREAKETMDIYAPLANRLGIGHLKWELEDLSFRYLNPEAYKYISKSLNSKRHEREDYVNTTIQLLEHEIKSLGVEKMEVTGRAKHIYSIYRKMKRKNVDITEIYDVTAFRILVLTIADCYTVLGHIHSLWKHIPKEFDDYITKPKANGYRSIHTAIYGPENKQIEIQIRTFEMHDVSELGVAAHWVYKEGGKVKAGYEAKIAWLRQVMDWQKEVTDKEHQPEIYSQVFDDRIYVFTPNGDVIDLPSQATPLDFAYHIHSELGNRCRGAKVNGHMVPLTYQLHTGECVEILTTKEGHPSRDWLNQNLGYLTTARAKAKVLNWFRKLDYEKNLADGKELLEKEAKRLNLKNANLEKIAQQLNYKNSNDMIAGLGRGDAHLSTIIHAIHEQLEPKTKTEAIPESSISHRPKPTQAITDIQVEGVGNLLTHMAHCCKPIPGDSIIGYITLNQGVSIHRQDCVNILHVADKQKERLIQVNWGAKTQEKYAVDLSIHAYDRQGLVRDISNLLANEKISILSLNCTTSKKENTAHVTLTIEIDSLNPLSRILTQIHQLPNITEVKRLG